MDRNDQQAIDALFGKLAQVERQSPPRDQDAEAFIRERVAAQPAAPYYLAQTVVVQEQALEAAQARIEELEYQVSRSAQSSGGLFSKLFGGDSRPAPRPRSSSSQAAMTAGAAPQQPWQAAQPQRGGFLAGAAQTAMGVAGGVLLGNAIAGMLGGDEAQAAEPEPEEEAHGEDAGADDGGDMEF
ncbi:DUF2076 domain-containing protein [Novispirillum sp. DQ9]|uniref:DUF2076 domain-containing protein n=1 Tax=Novispirillum sp. DQ9 TaxID=3398612 RepID=UPI003C7DD315